MNGHPQQGRRHRGRRPSTNANAPTATMKPPQAAIAVTVLGGNRRLTLMLVGAAGCRCPSSPPVAPMQPASPSATGSTLAGKGDNSVDMDQAWSARTSWARRGALAGGLQATTSCAWPTSNKQEADHGTSTEEERRAPEAEESAAGSAREAGDGGVQPGRRAGTPGVGRPDASASRTEFPRANTASCATTSTPPSPSWKGPCAGPSRSTLGTMQAGSEGNQSRRRRPVAAHRANEPRRSSRPPPRWMRSPSTVRQAPPTGPTTPAKWSPRPRPAADQAPAKSSAARSRR